MRNKKYISMLLTAALTVSMSHLAFAGELELAQSQRDSAASALATKQGMIGDLTTKKQELEVYLQGINQQYVELQNAVTNMSLQVAEKEDELKTIHADLVTAQNASKKQYDAMKLRIQYIYEKGGTTMMQNLLASNSMADFVNNAVSIMAISDYDRAMLTKYETLQKEIGDKEVQVQNEKTEIETMMTERTAAKQEMQSLMESTNAQITSYVTAISANQAEADALMAEINSADSKIASLSVVADYSNTYYSGDDSYSDGEDGYYDSDEDSDYEESYDEYDDDEDSDYASYVEESDEEESDYDDEYDESSYDDESDDEYTDYDSEEESYDSDENVPTVSDDGEIEYTLIDDEAFDSMEESEESSSSVSGKYLGNFTLTAYCNCASCCGTAGNPTASGTMPTAGNTVAMGGVPFGTQLLINGNVYTVEDRGTSYGHVDIYMDSHSAALAFGLQTADVYQVG